MRTGRPTEEQKNETVVIRLPYRQMKYVKRRAISRGCSVSQLIRELIDEEMERNS